MAVNLYPCIFYKFIPSLKKIGFEKSLFKKKMIFEKIPFSDFFKKQSEDNNYAYMKKLRRPILIFSIFHVFISKKK